MAEAGNAPYFQGVATATPGDQNALRRSWAMPFLNRLVGFLVGGDPELQVVRFCNAGIVCLGEEHDAWSVSWIMTPELFA